MLLTPLFDGLIKILKITHENWLKEKKLRHFISFINICKNDKLPITFKLIFAEINRQFLRSYYRYGRVPIASCILEL